MYIMYKFVVQFWCDFPLPRQFLLESHPWKLQGPQRIPITSLASGSRARGPRDDMGVRMWHHQEHQEKWWYTINTTQLISWTAGVWINETEKWAGKIGLSRTCNKDCLTNKQPLLNHWYLTNQPLIDHWLDRVTCRSHWNPCNNAF